MAYSLVLVLREHNEPHWELHTRERLSIDVSSAPLPLSLWDICSSCPLVLLSAGQSVCLRVCMHSLRWGWLGRLVWGVLWHLPLWRGPARTLVGHHIYQWLIVTSRSPWKHNRDLSPLFSTKAARCRGVTIAPGRFKKSTTTFYMYIYHQKSWSNIIFYFAFRQTLP